MKIALIRSRSKRMMCSKMGVERPASASAGSIAARQAIVKASLLGRPAGVRPEL
jgi:hypothetical protein